MATQINILLQKSLEQLQIGNLEMAEEIISRGLKDQPRHFDCLHILGVIKGMQGDALESIKALKAASEIKKNDFGVQFNLAKALMEAGDFEGSLIHHRKAISLNPNNPDCFVNYAKSLKEVGRLAEAVDTYEKALRISPSDFEIWLFKGLVLNESSRYQEALQALDSALKINPNFPPALFTKGVVFYDQGRFEDAITFYESALKLDQNNPQFWFNKGLAQNELKQYEAALQAFRRASELDPAYADAQFGEALTKLTLGDLEDGFKKFETRWLKANPPKHLHPELPLVNNVDQIAGKTVLVWEEEGFGDAIQFCRFIPKLVELGAKVIFETRPELVSFFGALENITLIIRGEQFEGVDYQVPLQTLPLLFNTSISSIPYPGRYLLVGEWQIKQWAERLSLTKEKLNIGVATFINEKYLNSSVAKRAMPLGALEPLLELANLFVIQKSIPQSDIDFIERHQGIEYLGDEIRDFSDSAAIIENMDLIIAVDTSLAHVAGALEKPVFIMLPWAADWRWFLDPSKTPWYSSATLFRQNVANEWSEPVANIVRALKSRT